MIWLVGWSCILLKFYIKPQLRVEEIWEIRVVSYWNSTSNHNSAWLSERGGCVVSYWNSTSNHNIGWYVKNKELVVSYWNSTSNHNSIIEWRKVYRVVSYWNSTSNHNIKGWRDVVTRLYLIEILHQTTTLSARLPLYLRCILLKFYIKPQLIIACYY